jgi:hypothetical protein
MSGSIDKRRLAQGCALLVGSMIVSHGIGKVRMFKRFIDNPDRMCRQHNVPNWTPHYCLPRTLTRILLFHVSEEATKTLYAEN